jgi:predicted secreted hydrolase
MDNEVIVTAVVTDLTTGSKLKSQFSGFVANGSAYISEQSLPLSLKVVSGKDTVTMSDSELHLSTSNVSFTLDIDGDVPVSLQGYSGCDHFFHSAYCQGHIATPLIPVNGTLFDRSSVFGSIWLQHMWQGRYNSTSHMTWSWFYGNLKRNDTGQDMAFQFVKHMNGIGYGNWFTLKHLQWSTSMPVLDWKLQSLRNWTSGNQTLPVTYLITSASLLLQLTISTFVDDNLVQKYPSYLYEGAAVVYGTVDGIYVHGTGVVEHVLELM